MTRSAGMPTRSAIARAVRSSSPVTSQTSRPWRCSSATASAAPGLSASVTGAKPSRRSPAATQAGVIPCAATRSASAWSEATSMPCSRSRRAVPTQDPRPIDHGLDAEPADRTEALDSPETELVLARPGEDRGPDRVLAPLLDGARQVEQFVGRHAGCRDDPADRRAADGQRSGLVEHDRIDPMGGLERLATADEDAGLRATTGPDHDRGRRRQAHRARAGDDQDRDERGQGEGQAWLRAGDEPGEERRRGDDQDERHEHLGDAVGEALDRRLRALGPLDEVDDAGQRRVAPDPRRAHHERAGRVLGRPDDLVAWSDRDRDRLAGQHRCVDGGSALDDDTVDGDPVAGPDTEEVADRDGLERHLVVRPVTHDERGRRTEADQPMDRAGRPALGAGLEPAPEQDETDDDRRRIEVGDGLDTGRRDEVRPHRDHDAVGPGRRRADRHERVHVGRPVAGRPPRRAVEAAAGPELDERRRDQDEPVECRHRDRRLRHEHHDHDPGGDRDRGQRPEEQPACGARPLEVVRGELGGKAGRRDRSRPGSAAFARRSRRPRWLRRERPDPRRSGW